jgi:two-component system, cell cycle sensor histidine kinase and response regulator CckA
VTILVVEDSPEVLTLVDRLLSARGHTVLSAPDPDHAAFVIAEHGAPPELLLVDIVLAGTSGVDYARTMKAAHPALKIVFMTGWLHRAPTALRSALGPVLRKPFTAQELYDIVESR